MGSDDARSFFFFLLVGRLRNHFFFWLVVVLKRHFLFGLLCLIYNLVTLFAFNISSIGQWQPFISHEQIDTELKPKQKKKITNELPQKYPENGSCRIFIACNTPDSDVFLCSFCEMSRASFWSNKRNKNKKKKQVKMKQNTIITKTVAVSVPSCKMKTLHFMWHIFVWLGLVFSFQFQRHY